MIQTWPQASTRNVSDFLPTMSPRSKKAGPDSSRQMYINALKFHVQLHLIYDLIPTCNNSPFSFSFFILT